ncbi:MAG: helix-turn-helix transcriptional regulator [Acutalibacteraceae bacterium]|nr:helix-turn-helix transcriptional regulator [Acutalibacteraceae bacterium]
MNSEKIGAFIKALRKEKNLTQKDLAEILQCTDKAISRWETGRGIPEISFLIPLSKALGISVNELLMGEKFPEEEIKEKTEQLIVETITHTDKKIGGLKNMLYLLFCIIQFILFYILPLTGGPTDVMGIVFLMYIGTMVNSFIMGLTPIKLKPKLLFTFVVILLFVPSVFLPFFSGDLEVLCLYTPTLAAFHLAFVMLGVGVRKLIEVIRKSLDD